MLWIFRLNFDCVISRLLFGCLDLAIITSQPEVWTLVESPMAQIERLNFKKLAIDSCQK